MIGEILGTWAESISLRRRAAGTTTLGRHVQGAVTTTTILAVVVPATGRELLKLPEGLRGKETIRIMSEAALLADPIPDEFTYRGQTWELKLLSTWPQGAFYDALAQRKAEQ